MASIVINGDTSGSVTIQAANVAGATTLNLPTVSGSILSASDNIPNNSILTISNSVLVTANLANGVILNNSGTYQTIAPGIKGTSLTSNGSAWLTTNPDQLYIRLTNTQIFTANGTWIKPNNAVFVYGWVVGAGGSGGVMQVGSGSSYVIAGGGGSGGNQAKWFRVQDLPDTVPITVGRGGASATGIPSSGNPGGNTFFGTYLSGYGGGGGGYMIPNTSPWINIPYGGQGGTASAGTNAISGAYNVCFPGTSGNNVPNITYYAYPQVFIGRNSQNQLTSQVGQTYLGGGNTALIEKVIVNQNWASGQEFEINTKLPVYYNSSCFWSTTFTSDNVYGAALIFTNPFGNSYMLGNSAPSQGTAAYAGGYGCGGGAASGAASGKGGDGIVFVLALG